MPNCSEKIIAISPKLATLASGQFFWMIHRQTDRQTDRQAGRQTGRQTDRQTDKQAGRQARRQADRHARTHARRHARTHARTHAQDRDNLSNILTANQWLCRRCRIVGRWLSCRQAHSTVCSVSTEIQLLQILLQMVRTGHLQIMARIITEGIIWRERDRSGLRGGDMCVLQFIINCICCILSTLIKPAKSSTSSLNPNQNRNLNHDLNRNPN